MENRLASFASEKPGKVIGSEFLRGALRHVVVFEKGEQGDISSLLTCTFLYSE